MLIVRLSPLTPTPKDQCGLLADPKLALVNEMCVM